MKPVGLDQAPRGHCNTSKGHELFRQMSEVEEVLVFLPSCISSAGGTYVCNYLCGSKKSLGPDTKEQSLILV